MPCTPLRTVLAVLALAAGLSGLPPTPVAAIDLWAETGYVPPRAADQGAARAAVERDRLRHLSTRLESRELSLEARRRVLTRLPQNVPASARIRAIDRRLDRLEDEQRRIDRALSPRPPSRASGNAVSTTTAATLNQLPDGVVAVPMQSLPAGSPDASETARLFVERLLRQNDARQPAR